MKTLHLLRHAKSSWDDPVRSDRERPLAPRGRRAAERLARHLDAAQVRPRVVLCSPAVRARQTLDAVEGALGNPSVEIDETLYGADAERLLEEVRGLPDDVDEVLLIGHDPALHDLALDLAADGERLEQLREKLPTGALVTLTFEGPWRDLGPSAAHLAAFVRPRELS